MIRLGDAAATADGSTVPATVPLTKAQMKAMKQQIALAAQWQKLDLRAANAERKDTALAIKAIPKQAKADALTTGAGADAESGTTLATAKAALLKALPWVAVGVAVIVGVVIIKKRRK